MKEIIYIQAGNISNYVGTHFWNTQESYFTFGNDEDERQNLSHSVSSPEAVEVNHDVSFREGLSSQATNFGTLGQHNGLYPDTIDVNEGNDALWNGDVFEVKQDAIAKSAYQERLDGNEEDDDFEEFEEFEDAPRQSRKRMDETRYWSDFSRVYFIPRSIQQVPDVPEWEANKQRWKYGKSLYEQYDKDHLVQEECLRKFAEECDSLQGFQITFDNDAFGGFSSALLEDLRDDYPKASVLAFPILSGEAPAPKDLDDECVTTAIQDAACLLAMKELESHSVVIRHPRTWTKGPWSHNVPVDLRNLYHTSAVLSTHIENATYPLRLKPGYNGENTLDLSSLIARLDWQQAAPYSHLKGILPLGLANGSSHSQFMCDFSGAMKNCNEVGKSRSLCVWRGSSLSSKLPDTPELGYEPHNIVIEEGYPYLTSYPAIIPYQFITRSDSASPRSLINKKSTRASFSMLSALCAMSTTASSLYAYADVVRSCARRKLEVEKAGGFDENELAEMEESLRYLADRYEEAWE